MDEKKKICEMSGKAPGQEKGSTERDSAERDSIERDSTERDSAGTVWPENGGTEPESRAAEPIRLMPFRRSAEREGEEGVLPAREPLSDQRQFSVREPFPHQRQSSVRELISGQRPFPGWGPEYGCRRCGMQREELRENSVWQDGGFGRGMAGRGLPFYMTSPMYWEEDTARRDLDYLVSLYPAQAKRFQDRIGRLLDTMDYRGSMIYDEYPDRMALERLAATVTAQIRREEETAWREKEDCGNFRSQEGEAPSVQPHRPGAAGRSEAEWEQMGEMIQILLFLEIFRRRQGAGRRKYFFMDR